MSALGQLLRNRDFSFFWIGTVVSNLGTRATQAAVLYQVYQISDMIEACTNAKALSVIQAAPKFAAPYAAMAKHAPKSKAAVDELIAKRREALS